MLKMHSLGRMRSFTLLAFAFDFRGWSETGCEDASAVEGVLVEVDSMGKGVGVEMGMRVWKKQRRNGNRWKELQCLGVR